jgi:hypothetical protein
VGNRWGMQQGEKCTVSAKKYLTGDGAERDKWALGGGGGEKRRWDGKGQWRGRGRGKGEGQGL